MKQTIRCVAMCMMTAVLALTGCSSDANDQDSDGDEAACVEEEDFELANEGGCQPSMRLKAEAEAESCPLPTCISEEDRSVLAGLQDLISGVWRDDQDQTVQISCAPGGELSCPSMADPEVVQNCMVGWSIEFVIDSHQGSGSGWFACESNHCPDEVENIPALGEGSSFFTAFTNGKTVSETLTLMQDADGLVLATKNAEEAWTVVYRKDK